MYVISMTENQYIIHSQENVYTLLGKVLEAKKSYIQEGNQNPSREELARRVGMSVEKLGKLLYCTRMPVSMQQTVWADQDTTFQVEIVVWICGSYIISICMSYASLLKM